MALAFMFLIPLTAKAQQDQPETPNVTGDYITLTNSKGMTAVILPLGAIVQRLIVPDKNGNPVDVALGMNTAREYLVSTAVEWVLKPKNLGMNFFQHHCCSLSWVLVRLRRPHLHPLIGGRLVTCNLY